MTHKRFDVIDRPTPRPLTSPYLTTAEAAAYLRLSERGSLYDLMHHHNLPYLRCGSRYRFDKAALDAWLEDNSRRASTK